MSDETEDFKPISEPTHVENIPQNKKEFPSQHDKIKAIQESEEKKLLERHIDITDPTSFMAYKHRFVPTESDLEDQKIIDNVDIPESQKIKEYIFLVGKNKHRVVKVDRITSDIIQIRDEITTKYGLKSARFDAKTKKKEKYIVKQFFTGVDPQLEYDTTARKTLVRIVHFAYEDEPFTRSWGDMAICDHIKKWEKLVQLGVAIRHDNLDELCKVFVVFDEQTNEYIFDEEDVARQLYNKSPTGFVITPEWAGPDIFGQPRAKFNIEDINYMKEEIYNAMASDIYKENMTAMAQDPYAKKFRDTLMIILMFLVFTFFENIGLVYLLSGHLA